MRSDLQATTERFETWRHCGLMLKPEIWVNRLEIICEEGLLNGCGHARSVPKNTLVRGEVWGDIGVVNAEWYWLM